MERGQPERIWYISFATETAFLGGVFVKARGPNSALEATHKHRCNPGGEVLIAAANPEIEIPEEFCNRLLTKGELEAIDEALDPSSRPN